MDSLLCMSGSTLSFSPPLSCPPYLTPPAMRQGAAATAVTHRSKGSGGRKGTHLPFHLSHPFDAGQVRGLPLHRKEGGSGHALLFELFFTYFMFFFSVLRSILFFLCWRQRQGRWKRNPPSPPQRALPSTTSAIIAPLSPQDFWVGKGFYVVNFMCSHFINN